MIYIIIILTLSNSFALEQTLRRRLEVLHSTNLDFFSNETIPTQRPIQTCDSSSDCEDNDACTINICSDGICTSQLNCEQCGMAEVKLDVHTDLYPEETSWEIIQSVSHDTYSASPIMAGGPYESPNTLYSDNKCFDHGIYKFIIMDADGFCCIFGTGNYTLFINDEELASGGEFSQVEEVSLNITIDEATSTPTNSPINYNSPLSSSSDNAPTLPTMFPTHSKPIPHPTEPPPTPFPNEIPPTPFPTEIPPTPFPTEIPPTPFPTEILATIFPTMFPTHSNPTPHPTSN